MFIFDKDLFKTKYKIKIINKRAFQISNKGKGITI